MPQVRQERANDRRHRHLMTHLADHEPQHHLDAALDIVRYEPGSAKGWHVMPLSIADRVEPAENCVAKAKSSYRTRPAEMPTGSQLAATTPAPGSNPHSARGYF